MLDEHTSARYIIAGALFRESDEHIDLNLAEYIIQQLKSYGFTISYDGTLGMEEKIVKQRLEDLMIRLDNGNIDIHEG